MVHRQRAPAAVADVGHHARQLAGPALHRRRVALGRHELRALLREAREVRVLAGLRPGVVPDMTVAGPVDGHEVAAVLRAAHVPPRDLHVAVARQRELRRRQRGARVVRVGQDLLGRGRRVARAAAPPRHLGRALDRPALVVGLEAERAGDVRAREGCRVERRRRRGRRRPDGVAEAIRVAARPGDQFGAPFGGSAGLQHREGGRHLAGQDGGQADVTAGPERRST